MLNRREFSGAALAAAGVSLLTASGTNAQGLPVVRLANASGIIDSQLIFLTMGQHPKLKYFEQEGCVLDILNMSSVSQAVQSVTSNNCESAPCSAVVFLSLLAKNPNIDIIFPYIWLRQPYWSVAVKPDSPIKKLEDLKGKTIGIRNQGDTGYVGAKAMYKELGLDPDKDIEWVSVGEGGPAGESVYKGRVDAMALWDGAFARMELAGFPLRHLPVTPGTNQLFGNGYCVRKSEFAKNRDLYVRFFRAMAKSTLFAHTAPELSVKMHWDLYPETKPKGKTDEEALKEQLLIVNVRKDKWLPGAWQADKRFGTQTKEEWEAQIKFAGLVKDISGVFSTELLDDINKFDKDAIIAQAKSMKL